MIGTTHARWIAAGVSVLALTGAGAVSATTEPPDDTMAADTMAAEDTSMSSDDMSMGTDDMSMGASSEPMTGAGPSDCPAITEDSADSVAEGTGATEGTEATDATGTMATETTASMDTGAGSMAPDMGSMAPDMSAAPMSGPVIQIVETDEYGPILVDGGCFTVYAFSPDVAGEPTCIDDCAATWPPVLVADEVPALADELDPSLFSVVDHPTEGPMLKVGDWPLYYFAGDMAPGDTNGQGVGGVWWVVAPDGSLIETDEGAEESEGTQATEDTDAAAGTEAAGTEAVGTEAVAETTEG